MMNPDLVGIAPQVEWSEVQMREALRIVLRHTSGAPAAQFGDTRERSRYIRSMVHRVSHASRLRLELGAVMYLCENMTLTRQEKTQLFDVAHELRGELAVRHTSGGE